MSVLNLLASEEHQTKAEIDRLDQRIREAEADLDRARERMAELHLRVVECHVSANILRDHNLRVERREGVVHVSVDPDHEPTR